jgi:zinc protease
VRTFQAAIGIALLSVTVLSVGESLGGDTPRHPLELTLPPLDFELPALAQETLKNGIPLYGVENHDLPLVTVVASFRVGRRYVPVEEFAAIDLLGDAWESGGTSALDPDAFDARLAALDATIRVGIGPRSGQVTVNCVREDLGDVLELWRDVLLHPRFAPDRLDRARAKQLQGLQSINDHPNRIAARWFRWQTRGRDHLGSRIETRASFEAVTSDDLHELHGRFVHPVNAILGVSGDVDLTELAGRLDDLFAGWETEGFEAPALRDWPVEPSAGVFLVPGEFAQSHVEVGHYLPNLGMSSTDYPGSQILDFAVGYGRLFYRSREAGLTYGTGVVLRIGSEDGLLESFGSCRPEVTSDLVEMILEELRGVKTNPLSADEIAASRTFRVGGLISESEVSRRLLRSRLVDLSEGRTESFRNEYLRGLQACSPEGVQGIVERHFAPEDELTVLVVGDPSKFDRSLDELGLGEVTELAPVVFGE